MRIKSPAADIFFALVEYSNANRWENPFQLDNDQLSALTCMSISNLKKHRKALHEAGFIGYLPGQQLKAAPWYKLYQDDRDYKDDPRWRGGYFVAMDAATKSLFLRPSLEDSKPDILVSTETIVRGPAEKNGSGPGGGQPPGSSGPRFAPEEKGSVQKEEDEEYHKVPYWRVLRSNVWFAFYKKHFGRKPTFKGRDWSYFREILLLLEKQHIQDGFAWTEEAAKKSLLEFLESAIQDDFLKKKFLLINLFAQYDAIIANKSTGAFAGSTASSTGQPAAAAATVRSRGGTYSDILSAQRVGAPNSAQ